MLSDRDASVGAGGRDAAREAASAAAANDGAAVAAKDGGASDAAANDAAIDGPTTAAGGDAGIDGSADAGPASANDAGANDAGGNDGGGTTAPVPGLVSCGASACNVILGEFCCVQADGTESCSTSSVACAALGGVVRRCDKASDCLAGNVCCYDFSTFPASAGCRGDCGGGGGTRVQACRGQAECTAGTCAVHACVDAGPIESCEPHTPECP